MGDLLPKVALPQGIDTAKVKQAIDAAFEPAAEQTAAIVVTWRGRIIGERYAPGITEHTPLELVDGRAWRRPSGNLRQARRV